MRISDWSSDVCSSDLCWSSATPGWSNRSGPRSSASTPATKPGRCAPTLPPCCARRCRANSTSFSSIRRSTTICGPRCWPRCRRGLPMTPGCTSNRRPTAPWNRVPAGAFTGKAAAVTRGTPCTVDPAGALLHWHGLPTTARRALHERGPQPHRGLSRHLRSDHQRPRRPGRSRSALVRSPDRRRGREPGQAPGAAAAAARGPGPRRAGAPWQRRGSRLRLAAGAFRRGSRWWNPAARAARGVGLRVRIPAGQHEPAPDSRSRDAVPDARRAVRLHFVLAGARDLAPGRGCLRVRACGRGQGAAGRVAADRRMSTHFQPPVQGSTMKNFSTNIPIRILQVLLVACFVLPLAACNKEEAPKAVEKAPVPVPTTDDIVEWRAYVSDVVRRNMGAIANQPYVYLLPGESDGDFEGNYERLAEKAHTDVARGIIRGNMLAYASPASAKMADIVIAAFKDVPPDTMEGVRVVFIGDAADGERVKAAVSPAGVTYVFVEAK